MISQIFFRDTGLPITVELEDPYSYSRLPIWITIAVIATSIIIVLAIFLIRRLLRHKDTTPKPKVFTPKPLMTAKTEYLSKVNAIEQNYRTGTMDARTAHQELSATVRMFVYDLTGIEAQNFSLNELKARKIRISYLIEEFYAPEFAQRSDKETLESIADARRVISSWS